MAKELSEEKTMVQALIDNQEKMKLLDQEKDKRIQDLEDQMRDLMFYLDAQKKVCFFPHLFFFLVSFFQISFKF